MNVLDVDPKNLAYDFRRDWKLFQDGRVKKFLAAWLQKELKEARGALEYVAPENLGKSQGIVCQIKKMSTLIEKQDCQDSLKEVLTFLDSTEK